MLYLKPLRHNQQLKTGRQEAVGRRGLSALSVIWLLINHAPNVPVSAFEEKYPRLVLVAHPNKLPPGQQWSALWFRPSQEPESPTGLAGPLVSSFLPSRSRWAWGAPLLPVMVMMTIKQQPHSENHCIYQCQQYFKSRDILKIMS